MDHAALVGVVEAVEDLHRCVDRPGRRPGLAEGGLQERLAW